MNSEDLTELFYGLVITSKTKREIVPLKDINISAQITGFVANVDTSLLYKTTEPVEAEFVFPVDDNSAVYKFEAVIGDRCIKAECQEKDEAHQTYRDAMDAGHTAFLLEEDARVGDVFRMKVGNLPPNSDVIIRFSYVMELATTPDGLVTFVVPNVLVPRYGGDISDGTTFSDDGITVMSGDTSYSLAFSATIEGCSPVMSVTSPGDSLRPVGLDGESKVVKVVLGKPLSRHHDTRMDIQYKDPFTPHVLCEPGDGERGGILKQEVIMLNFLPELSQSDFSTNREFIFVIDRSGSMIGSNMHNACEALLLFLKSLPAGCYFNIVSFGSDYKFLFEGGSVEYNETNLHKAETCQRKMSADMGGTEIYEPLREIYNRPPLKGFSRQIFVLTDGEVCDTKRVVRLVKQNATNSRVFAVGIGEGASTALVRGIARAGRGQAEFVTGKDRLQAKVMKLLSQALQSSVSDLKLDWSGARVSGQELVVPPTVVPQPIPPVFHGSRLILYALFESLVSLSAPLSGTCTLTGSVEGREISFELDLSDLEKLKVNEGHLPLHRLAAKAQIKQLEVQLKDGYVDSEEKSRLKTLITMLSMSANVVSSKTAFVGYDRERKIVSAKTPVHTEYMERYQGHAVGIEVYAIAAEAEEGEVD